MKPTGDQSKQAEVSDDDIIGAVLRRSLAAKSAAPVREKPKSTFGWKLWGFEGKARIQTNFGLLPIEALRLRDSVLTQTGAYRKVVWIDTVRLDTDFLDTHSSALPILIGAESIGPGRPLRSVLVSPMQLVNTSRFGPATAMSEAIKLTGRPGIQKQATGHVTYYLFSYGEEGPVSVEGLWCHTETSSSLPLDQHATDDE
jgi:hypothetical protein